MIIMTFIQKLRHLAITMTILIAVEAFIVLFCYKLGILKWFLLVLGASVIFEVVTLVIDDIKER